MTKRVMQRPKELALWEHQRSAIEMCEKFFASFSTRSALVHLPTGTGKTGVMAVVASMRAVEGPVLIICPSSALVAQLVEDIGERFWRKVDADTSWKPDKTLHLLPSALEDVARQLGQRRDGRYVVCATIQTMQQLFAVGRHRILEPHIGTILFDEGHREPAPEWAKAVRAFSVPTILFSATPYRNDLKLFDIEDKWISFLSFAEAVEAAVIRGVEVSERQLSKSAREFAKQVVAIRNQAIGEGRYSSEAKMIVRAASEDAVRALFQAFLEETRATNDGVLAVHNTFDLEGPDGRQMRGDVPPRLAERAERFVIHQHMMTEGIDDPGCTMLALYDAFTNERQLVQQVGRLTRNPNPGTTPKCALVLARKGDGVQKTWKRFLDYDNACIANAGRPPVRNDSSVLESLVEALPRFDYMAGKFRLRVDFDEPLGEELRFPRSAIIYTVGEGFEIDSFERDVSAALLQDDRFERKVGKTLAGQCHYHVSLALKQSPYLEESIFHTASLEVTIYALCDRRLFFFDSGGLWMDEHVVDGDRLSGDKLISLLPDHPDCAVTSVAIKNADLGPLALRSRTMSGRSLATSGVFMGEQTYVVGRATGRYGSVARSITLSRGRMRQLSGTRVTASEFLEWAVTVSGELNREVRASPLFSRYASPVGPPTDATPLNVLIDIENLNGEFLNDAGDTVEINPDHACVEVLGCEDGPGGYGRYFDLEANDEWHRVWIKWDTRKKKYWLNSSTLSAIKLRDNERITLTHRLNQQQPFRLIPSSRECLYAYGQFYSVDLRLDVLNGPARLVLDLIQPVSGLLASTSEKGALVGAAETWPEGSLFRFIDLALCPGARRHRPLGTPFSQMVCDDIGQEAADFIALDDEHEPRVALIAAKWVSGPAGVSASALYDVCSQAVKNLSFLKIDSQELPGTAQKWNHDWRLNGGRVPRLRAGTTSAEFRRSFAIVRRNPRSRREMWLVLGGGILSKEALESGFKSGAPQPHVLQTYHLLLSVLSSCQSIGVNLRLFCAE